MPITYYKLPNGLRVILSPDSTAPTVVAAVYYRIGFRVEPKDRTGFAHLFEHMMFQGSQNLGKMEFIRLVQQNGGILNGSTRFDFTNYYLPTRRGHSSLGLSKVEQHRYSAAAVRRHDVRQVRRGGLPVQIREEDLPRAAAGSPSNRRLKRAITFAVGYA